MVRKNDKQQDVAVDSEKFAKMIRVAISGVLDYKKNAELEEIRREVIKVANVQIENLKAVAEAEIVAINDKAAAERKIINDRAAVERKNVRDKLNAELKSINEEVEAELKKIDDMLFQQKLGMAKGVAGVIGSTGVFDNLPFFGKATKK